MKFIYTTSLLITILLTLTSAKLDPDTLIDHTKKVKSCINLIQARLHYDKPFFTLLLKDINLEPSSKAFSEAILDKLLPSCYNSIPMLSTATLSNKKDYINIDPFQSDNRQLLSLKKHKELFNDQTKWNKNKERLNEVLDLIKEEKEALIEFIQKQYLAYLKYVEEETERKKKEKEEEEKERKMEEELRRGSEEKKRRNEKEREDFYSEDYYSLNIFGFHLNQIHRFWKNVIGGSFLILFGLALWLGLRYLMKKPELKNKKKKN